MTTFLPRRVQSLRPASGCASGGFTLIELLVVITIMAVMIAMLIPSLKGAREAAKAVVCSTQMRQVNIAINNYSTDNHEFYPYSAWRYDYTHIYTWDKLIQHYLGAAVMPYDFTVGSQPAAPFVKAYCCPSDPLRVKTTVRSYDMNQAISSPMVFNNAVNLLPAPIALRSVNVADSMGTFLLVEVPNNTGRARGYYSGTTCPSEQSAALNGPFSLGGTIYTANPPGVATHPGEMFNYSYVDGHSKAFYPRLTDNRAPAVGAPATGMRGYNAGILGGYYWYTQPGVATGGWSVSGND